MGGTAMQIVLSMGFSSLFVDWARRLPRILRPGEKSRLRNRPHLASLRSSATPFYDGRQIDRSPIVVCSGTMSAMGQKADTKSVDLDIRFTPQERTCSAPPSMSAKFYIGCGEVLCGDIDDTIR